MLTTSKCTAVKGCLPGVVEAAQQSFDPSPGHDERWWQSIVNIVDRIMFAGHPSLCTAAFRTCTDDAHLFVPETSLMCTENY